MTTLLVIEDSPTLLEELVDTLGFEGFDVLAADNGADGVRLAFEHLPSLIISDIMMPKMDGYEVLRTIRSAEETSGIPVIFLTARAGAEDIQKAVALGVNAYLTKPYRQEELMRKILDLVKA